MAILGFHFSNVYKNALISKQKKATILDKENYFRVGQKIQVYLSDKDNLFDGIDEKRIGEAIIEKVDIMKVRDISEKQAQNCASSNLEELKLALNKWYNCNEESIVTYVEFNLILF